MSPFIAVNCTTTAMMKLQDDDDYDSGETDVWEGERDAEDYVASIYASLKASKLIPTLADLHKGVDITKTKSYYCQSREWELEPGDVPLDHPVRAIARTLQCSSTRHCPCLGIFFDRSVYDRYALLTTHSSRPCRSSSTRTCTR